MYRTILLLAAVTVMLLAAGGEMSAADADPAVCESSASAGCSESGNDGSQPPAENPSGPGVVIEGSGIVCVGDEMVISGSGAPPDSLLSITMKRKCSGKEDGCSGEDDSHTGDDGCSGEDDSHTGDDGCSGEDDSHTGDDGCSDGGTGGQGGSGCSGGGCGQGGQGSGNQGRGRPTAELGTVKTDALGNWVFRALVPGKMMAGARARAGGSGPSGGGQSGSEKCELLPMPTPSGVYELIVAGESFLARASLTVLDCNTPLDDDGEPIVSPQEASPSLETPATGSLPLRDALPSTGHPMVPTLALAAVLLTMSLSINIAARRP